MVLLTTPLPAPPPYEWAVVLMFYAAVHHVNAYLWERQRFEPADHVERQHMLRLAAVLRPVYGAYGRLRTTAYNARYRSRFRITATEAEELLADLDRIEAAVARALGVST